jgi:hypothetical protein
VAGLLANGSDYDICQGVFRRVVRQNGGEVSAAGLSAEERAVVLVWYSLRVIEEDGYRALFEERIPGDRRWSKTVEAYEAIGCTRAARALRKTAARLAGDPTDEYHLEQVERSLKELASLRTTEERLFMEVIDEVEPHLVEYIRTHRECFLTLDDEEE